MLAVRVGHKDVFTWRVGDAPLKDKIDPFGQLYVEVTAYDRELEYVKNQFRGLPYHADKAMQTWYGDHAKFIIGNLR